MSVPLIKTPTVAEDTACLICQETPGEKGASACYFAHPDLLKPVELIHHVCLRCLKGLAGRNLSSCTDCRETFTAFPEEACSTSLQGRVGIFLCHQAENITCGLPIAAAGLLALWTVDADKDKNIPFSYILGAGLAASLALEAVRRKVESVISRLGAYLTERSVRPSLRELNSFQP